MGEPITVLSVRNAIDEHQFNHANETELHEGIVQVLTGLGLTVQREVRLNDWNRIDLTTTVADPAGAPLTLGVEVKVGGNSGSVRRQLVRYTGCGQLGALLLVTTVQRHVAEVMPYAVAAGDPAGTGARWLLRGMPFDVSLIRRGVL